MTTTQPRTALVTIVAWGLLLLGVATVVAAVVLVYPRDVERRLWYPLLVLGIVGGLAIRSAVALLRRSKAPRQPASTPPAA